VRTPGHRLRKALSQAQAIQRHSKEKVAALNKASSEVDRDETHNSIARCRELEAALAPPTSTTQPTP